VDGSITIVDDGVIDKTAGMEVLEGEAMLKQFQMKEVGAIIEVILFGN
jgi:hypothetical protein